MSHYTATVEWQLEPGAAFTDSRYSRAHVLRFDGGLSVPGSSSPSVVPLPLSRADAVDPEEAFVASLASCHMLWFLSLAAKAGFVVVRYVDTAEGTMATNVRGKLAMTVVTLRPRVRFAAPGPDAHAFERLHHEAHDECFIANSVRSEIRCEPTIDR